MAMKQLNQIILCSTSEGRSFLRELAVLDQFAIVTHIEVMPFRYHETLKKLKKTKDGVVRLTVPVQRSNRHNGCPFCGNTGTFQCKGCGYVSCRNGMMPDHTCPGCKKTYKAVPADANYASNSGFVNDKLQPDKTGGNQGQSSEIDLWNRANGKLLKLMHHRNAPPS
jgi:hypothetical protein